MKKFRGASLVTAVVAMSALAAGAGVPGASAVPAQQEGIRVIASGVTAEGGWVAYTGYGKVKVDGAASGSGGGMQALGVKEVGGGIWAYGSTIRLNGKKACYSQYEHKTVSHGSSVSMDGSTDSDWVGKGKVSDAYVTKYTTQTCYAYWRK